jgi:hypothetical protein
MLYLHRKCKTQENLHNSFKKFVDVVNILGNKGKAIPITDREGP